MNNALSLFDWQRAAMDSELTSTTKLLLLVMSRYVNGTDSICWPSIETLAEKTSLSVRALGRHLGIAERAGWITRWKSRRPGRSWAHNHYRLAAPADVAEPCGAWAVNEVADTIMPPAGALLAPRAGNLPRDAVMAPWAGELPAPRTGNLPCNIGDEPLFGELSAPRADESFDEDGARLKIREFLERHANKLPRDADTGPLPEALPARGADNPPVDASGEPLDTAAAALPESYRNDVPTNNPVNRLGLTQTPSEQTDCAIPDADNPKACHA